MADVHVLLTWSQSRKLAQLLEIFTLTPLHALRAGRVIAVQAGTGIVHGIRSGDASSRCHASGRASSHAARVRPRLARSALQKPAGAQPYPLHSTRLRPFALAW